MINEQDILNASILIVDDQQSNVLLLEEMLHDVGYACIASTTDPYMACELHRKNRYDLMLLDLQMPGLDGFQVMEGLKQIETGGYLPVLAITAQPGHKLRALIAGAKDFIAKPFDLVEIQTRIHNMLEVRLLYRELEIQNKVLEQKVLERTAELRESEARFRRLTELSSDWHWEQDKNGHFTKIFGPVYDMLGIRVNDDLTITRDYQGGTWNECERDILEEYLTTRQPFLDFVYSRTKPDGSQQYLMVSGEPIFSPSGRFMGYRGIGKEVTEAMATRQGVTSS
ncbi:putative PAS/PAC sensor protein [Methyloglobulus morosus KoM1]|uniref:Putative PAS/PAC sensor protein n=1 Tax=Methyloglobulus morosus KoM1 TaxID=1116472 RepID=V5C486_9GAMM|nr:response regulator [Methyloglobulus morosus]ESS71558.1 putative PAS/PAC sensor protein [Methyloglobulus morosus KoM1]